MDDAMAASMPPPVIVTPDGLGNGQMALFGARLGTEAILLLVLLVAVLWRPVVHLLDCFFFGTSDYTPIPEDGAPVPDDPYHDVSSSPGDSLVDDQPVPDIAPLRLPRRALILALLCLLAISHLSQGIAVVVRGVIQREWQGYADPSWRGIELSSALGFLAWSFAAIWLLWQERKQGGKGRFGRRTFAVMALVGLASGVAQVALFFITLDNERRKSLPHEPFTIIQLGFLAARVLLLILLILSLSFTKTIFVPVASLEGDHTTHADADADSIRPTSRAAAGYGTFTARSAGNTLVPPSSSDSGANTPLLRRGSSGINTPMKNPSPSRSPNHGSGAANGSAGNSGQPQGIHKGLANPTLSVSAPPPPPTLRVFLTRIKILFPYLWPQKSIQLQSVALFCFGLLLLGRVVNILGPLTFAWVVDDLQNGRAPWWSLLAYTGLRFLQGSGGILKVIQNIAWAPVLQYSDREMSNMTFNHLLNLSLAFHTKRKTGEVLRILDRGSAVNSFFEYLIFSILPIFMDITIAVVALLFKFGSLVSSIILVVMIAYVWVSVKMATYRANLRRQMNNKDSTIRAINTDTLLNYETVKIFSNETYEGERYAKNIQEYQVIEYKVIGSLNLLNLVQNFITALGLLVGSMVIVDGVVRGYRTAADFVFFIALVGQLLGPLNNLGTLYRVIQNNLVDTDKLMALLEEKTEVRDVEDAKELVVTEGVIEFDNVTFSYDGKMDALQSLTFKVPANSSVALVGESGGGKSTILKLLYRFYDVQGGRILIDGQDIRHVTQKSLRQAIGVVPQDPTLFNQSIKFNLNYGRVDADDDEIIAAAQAAQIHDRIVTFPDGYNTVVGERGIRLSGGEKQRVSIARTILKNPPILLLDEATSALDTSTEHMLQKELRALMRGRSSLTIAHRLSTIVNSDLIIVVGRGQVLEAGTHSELVSNDGPYAEMWKKQIQSQTEQLAEVTAARHPKSLASGASLLDISPEAGPEVEELVSEARAAVEVSAIGGHGTVDEPSGASTSGSRTLAAAQEPTEVTEVTGDADVDAQDQGVEEEEASNTPEVEVAPVQPSPVEPVAGKEDFEAAVVHFLPADSGAQETSICVKDFATPTALPTAHITGAPLTEEPEDVSLASATQTALTPTALPTAHVTGAPLTEEPEDVSLAESTPFPSRLGQEETAQSTTDAPQSFPTSSAPSQPEATRGPTQRSPRQRILSIGSAFRPSALKNAANKGKHSRTLSMSSSRRGASIDGLLSEGGGGPAQSSHDGVGAGSPSALATPSLSAGDAGPFGTTSSRSSRRRIASLVRKSLSSSGVTESKEDRENRKAMKAQEEQLAAGAEDTSSHTGGPSIDDGIDIEQEQQQEQQQQQQQRGEREPERSQDDDDKTPTPSTVGEVPPSSKKRRRGKKKKGGKK